MSKKVYFRELVLLKEKTQQRSSTRASITEAQVESVALSTQRYAREKGVQMQMWQFTGDLVFAFFGIVLGFVLRFHTFLAPFGVPENPTFSSYWPFFVLGPIFFQALLYHFKIYKPQNILRFQFVFRTLFKISFIWFFVFLGFALIFKIEPPVSRLFVLYSALSILFTVGLWRFVLHTILDRSMITAQLRQNTIIVGWNRQALQLYQSLQKDPSRPYEILGCVPSSYGIFIDTPPSSVEVLGDYEALSGLIRLHAIDTVILADLSPMMSEIINLANLCEKEHVDFKIIPSYFQILLSGLHLETLSSVPLLGIGRLPLDSPFHRFLKRSVDIVGALVGLLISIPLVFVCGMLVYLESPGPVFYFQKRLGRYGKIFNIIKIRSMKLNAEAQNGVQWCKKDDPRRLRIGAFLRKWNIDETPQFWNVLVGDMSLVGPRPERPELIFNFKEEIPHYNARHNIKPGITGWAQINGLRGDTDLTERIRCDLYYLENWSIFLDFYIMLMTFFKRKNAY